MKKAERQNEPVFAKVNIHSRMTLAYQFQICIFNFTQINFICITIFCVSLRMIDLHKAVSEEKQLKCKSPYDRQSCYERRKDAVFLHFI